ncbi:hypothetical protein [uncultured Porphyromonas sp.]|uniref:hypothetical protein n=1 Tax=uncultured Porphyromonas sp. TaxID=159274 RepID=UPI0025DBCE50|nr:hypothetical protein [uncultured Porphyromonas sp.]
MISLKKILATVVVALGLCVAGNTDVKAQNVFETGTNIASVGLGGSLHTDAAGKQYGSLTINITADHCLNAHLWDDNSAFTLGGQAVLNVFNGGTSYFIGPRGGLHYHFIPKLDTYYFVAIGLSGSHINGTKASSLGFGYNTGIGLRYMVDPSWGLFAEIGYGVSVLNIGASFSF